MLRDINLQALNSATEYPAIPTFHKLNPEDGMLMPDTVPFIGDVIFTEKVDGTNSRIILLPDGTYLIGSRELLLYARGDVVHNPQDGVVEALRTVAERLKPLSATAPITTFYFEVYGGKIGQSWREYTSTGAVGIRLFDVGITPESVIATMDPETIAGWRDRGGQTFLTEERMQRLAHEESLALVPRLAVVPSDELPTGLVEMHEYLGRICNNTLVGLDGGANRTCEGAVLRSFDRTKIAKARFSNYRRTLFGGKHRRTPQD